VQRPSRWEKIKEIVGTALERDAVHRATYLDEACAQNPTLRTEIESLISAYDQPGDDLSQSPLAGPLLPAAAPLQPIGPYRLLKILGEGGMGQVWLAEQTFPVRRQVALKLIRSGMLHSIALQRFQAERQSLAIMDHPCIAKVFDAGAAPGGQPYFVMEYVEGLPITRYCDQEKLPLPDRLRLFIQVCEAVQHAHQKAIIHRDLKPANILVVEIDGKPRPRIIDFGIAKAAVPSEPDATVFTQAGVLLGTPGYMSPEQIDPRIRDVDTRTDVYSLGVLLYELLTGSLPFDTQQLKKQPLDKLLRILREEDPPSPSTRVDADREKTIDSAERRGLEPAQLVSLLRGDLDWVTMKALERDRDRRYGSPSELAADIERYLQNRPVLARPASTSYRLHKYVRRHRVAVAVASGALALLIAFAVTQAVQLRRITRERDRANRITEFMTNMFKVADPNEARGNSITAREILDKSSKEIETGLAKDPQLQAQLMGTMGQVYVSMGLFPQGQAMLERAVQTGRRIGGPDDPDALRAMSYLSFLLLRQGRYADAERLFKEAIPGQERVFGANDVITLNTRRYLASVLEFEGKYSEADSVITKVLADDRRALGPENAEALRAMNVMANILDDEKRVPERNNSIVRLSKFKYVPSALMPRRPSLLHRTSPALSRNLAVSMRLRNFSAKLSLLAPMSLALTIQIPSPSKPILPILSTPPPASLKPKPSITKLSTPKPAFLAPIIPIPSSLPAISAALFNGMASWPKPKNFSEPPWTLNAASLGPIIRKASRPWQASPPLFSSKAKTPKLAKSIPIALRQFANNPANQTLAAHTMTSPVALLSLGIATRPSSFFATPSRLAISTPKMLSPIATSNPFTPIPASPLSSSK